MIERLPIPQHPVGSVQQALCPFRSISCLSCVQKNHSCKYIKPERGEIFSKIPGKCFVLPLLLFQTPVIRSGIGSSVLSQYQRRRQCIKAALPVCVTEKIFFILFHVRIQQKEDHILQNFPFFSANLHGRNLIPEIFQHLLCRFQKFFILPAVKPFQKNHFFPFYFYQEFSNSAFLYHSNYISPA